jgi:hypothetical protein
VSIFKSTARVQSFPVIDLSLEDRSNGASALAAYAVDRFTRTARDLEEAARLHEAVAAEAGAEILVLQDLADVALDEMDSARSAASKIKSIFA